MQVGKNGPNNFGNFRQRMQRVIRRFNPHTPATPDNLSPTASQPLLHRLHLYQTELEAQNKELRHTQLALEATRARYFDLLEYTSILYDQAPVGYLTLTNQGIILEANLTAAKMLSHTRDLLLQQPILHFIIAEDQKILHTHRQELLATHKPQRCELRMVRADGSFFFAQMDATLTVSMLGVETIGDILDSSDSLDSEQYIRVTISDITARIQLEEEERSVRGQLEATLVDLRQTQIQMVKQERLAVVGQLAAGIAHDFNNILAAITLYAQLIMRSADLPAHLHARMEVIAVQAGRATTLIQQMLDFSRRTVIARQSTALSPFLQELVELLQHTLPETIQVNLEIDSLEAGTDDVVSMDASRIQQVLLNLALNARDAMPDGGELRIMLSRIEVDNTFPPLASGRLTPGPWLRIIVSDTGSGIQPGDIPRVFEPFFTTKGVGAGSGLGLAQVWGIIKQHEGEIDITSHLNQGTTFSLYLPVLSTEDPPASLPPETVTIPSGHGETILMVEDNDVLRAALISALDQLGYVILEASNGQEAADLMTQERDKVKLILSDLIMPVMGGEALIRTLRAQGYDLPVVVLSGQPLLASEVEHLYRYGQISWLLKPPTLAQLAVALQRALHPRSAESA